MKIYEITDSTHVTHWITAASRDRAKAALMRYLAPLEDEGLMDTKKWTVKEMPGHSELTLRLDRHLGISATLTCQQWGAIYDVCDISNPPRDRGRQVFYLACSEY
jgi:hypothetical protein